MNAEKGFAFLREGTKDSLSAYTVQEALLKDYTDLGLYNANIYAEYFKDSEIHPNYTYTKWTMFVKSNTLAPNGGMPWSETKDKYKEYFKEMTAKIQQDCLPSLKLSPIIMGNPDKDDKFFCYIYHPNFNFPENIDVKKADVLLEEVPHIKLIFSEDLYPAGVYRIVFKICGVDYDE
jgi:hypothetical protein